MFELSLLLVFAVFGALWFDHRRVQDIAVARCRQACERAGVQFLDDVAPAWRVRLARAADGRLRLQRLFTFEYSTPTGERRGGSLVMLGRVPLALHLDSDAIGGGEIE